MIIYCVSLGPLVPTAIGYVKCLLGQKTVSDKRQELRQGKFPDHDASLTSMKRKRAEKFQMRSSSEKASARLVESLRAKTTP